MNSAISLDDGKGGGVPNSKVFSEWQWRSVDSTDKEEEGVWTLKDERLQCGRGKFIS